MVNNQSERAHCRPWGLDGGLDGTGNAVEIRLGGQWKTDFPNAKVLVAQLKPGDAFKIRSGGGGGYGDPLARPVEQVREDVRQGYVTVTAAAELYGVVLDPETFEIDVAATETLRAKRAVRAAAPRTRSRRRRGSPPRRREIIFTCQTANATPPGDFHFRAPGVALSPFSCLPRGRGTWSAGRRRAPRRAPCGPWRGPPRAVATARAPQ